MDSKIINKEQIFISSNSNYSTSTAYQYLRIFFNYLYYTCLSPFRFKKGKATDCYEIHTNYFQKIICGIIHAFISVYVVYDFLYTKIPGLRNSTGKNPTQIFEAFIYFNVMIYHLMLIYIVWRKKSHFKQILECCEKIQLTNETTTKAYQGASSWGLMKSIAVHLFISIFVIQDVVFIFIGDGYGFDCPSSIGNVLEESTFILHNAATNQNVSDFSNEQEVLKTWAYFSEMSIFPKLCFSLYSALIISVVECFLAIATLTLRHLSIEFSQLLLGRKVDADSVISSHKCVRSIVEHLNEGISSLTLLVIFCGIAYFAESLITAYFCTNEFYLCWVLAWAVFTTLELLTLAKANQRINRFKSWIIERASDPHNAFSGSQNQFLLQYIQACEETVALSGGSLFYITYSSVGTGLGLLVTFGIIILQLKTSCGTP